MTTKKPIDPPLAFFSAQCMALVGHQDPNTQQFTTFDDVCRFAAGECGFTGISVHTGMLDVRKMISDDEFRNEVVEHFKELGTPIIRLESHFTGQRKVMHPAVVPRFRGSAPKWAQHLPHQELEAQASTEMMDILVLSSLLGLKHHQTFSGARANPVATDPWNAHPPLLRAKTLATIAYKWEKEFIFAADTGIRIGFEIGHIMEDLFGVRDLIDLESYLLDPRASKALDWGVDFSHWEIEGDDPKDDAELALKYNIGEMGHAKQGYFDPTQPFARRRPANLSWKERAGKFCTFGTHNPQNSKLWVRMMREAHARLPQGTWLVYEAECMFIRNIVQAMKIAADNLRLVLADKEPRPMSDIIPESWEGPAFDSFADSGYTAEEVLALSAPETVEVQKRLEHADIAQ